MENLEKEILFLIEEYKKNQFTQSYEEYLQKIETNHKEFCSYDNGNACSYLIKNIIKTI